MTQDAESSCPGRGAALSRCSAEPGPIFPQRFVGPGLAAHHAAKAARCAASGARGLVLSRVLCDAVAIEHDPEKHALGPDPGVGPGFPRDKREAFARRSCSNKKIERFHATARKSFQTALSPRVATNA